MLLQHLMLFLHKAGIGYTRKLCYYKKPMFHKSYVLVADYLSFQHIPLPA
jgi:hypothetical protein